MATHTAILIGVGVTVGQIQQEDGRSEDRPLRGAVSDVQAVEAFLRASSRPVDITMLTTSGSQRNDPPSRTSNFSYALPTRKNVLDALKRVANDCAAGHQVYIHFSGHGTRRPVPEFYKRSWDSVALVLHSEGPSEGEYLFAEVLHRYLEKITKKGAYVTLVLDCCFSGSVMRTETHLGSLIRFLDYDSDEGENTLATLPGEDADPEAAEHYRGALMSMERHLALDPESYTILAACGLDEIAWECRLEDGTRMGAMTRFLLESLTALRSQGTRVSSRSLHRAVCTRIHAQITHQTPMLYGRGGSSFFDDLLSKEGVDFLPLYRTYKDDRITLGAGEAHGVQLGDIYAAYRFSTSEIESESAKQPYIRLRVESLHCLTSWMTSIQPDEDIVISRTSSWKARLLSSVPSRKAHVRLMPGIPFADQEQLLRKAEGRYRFTLSVHAQSELPSLYQVSITEEDSYQIGDAASYRVVNALPIPRNSKSSQESLLMTLDHLVAYKTFETLGNRHPDAHFEDSFICKTLYQPGTDDTPLANIAPGPDGVFDVQEGELFQLRLTNKGQRTLYIATAMLSSTWSIDNPLVAEGEGDYLPIPPKGTEESEDTGEEELSFRMIVTPDIIDAGLLQGWDILKVFVLSRPTSFPAVILPPISESMVRGSQEKLQYVLDELSVGVSKLRDDGVRWAVRDFHIRTSRHNVPTSPEPGTG